MASRVLAQHQRTVRYADALGPHYLVGGLLLQEAVLVDARFVGKGVITDNGLVGLHLHPGNAAYQAARRIDMLGRYAGLEAERVGSRLEYHDYLFKARVTGPLADTVYGALHLAGAVHHGKEAVGHGKPQVVMAVDRYNGAVYIGVRSPLSPL